MREFKKVVTILLVAAMAVIVFAGCGEQMSGTATDAATKAADTAQQSQTTAAKPKPVLKYLGRDATFDLANSPIIPVIEKLTGYTVEYEALPAGQEGETKLMMLVASGTPYDLINVAPTYFDRLLAANAARPLDEMIKKAPNLLKAVPENSKSWQRVRGQDGKLYAIPQLHPVDRAVNTIAYRKDILDNLGLPVPTTPEEFYNTLKEIKKKYPDMIPLTTDKAFSAPPIASGFDVYKDWYEVGGSLIPNQKRAEYKEYITYMRNLYAEGLLDKEFPANDGATRLQKFTSGKAAMTFFANSEGPGFYSALEKNIPEAKVDYIPFLKDKNGNKGTMATSGGLEKAVVIPKTAANPEDAIAWIDAFMANFKEIYIGPEGVDHKVEDGKYIPIMPAFSVHDTVWWFMPAVDEANVFDWWQARVRKNAEVERGYMDTFALRTPDVNVVTPLFSMYPPNEEFIKLRVNLDQYWQDEMVKIVSGATSLDNYEKVVEKWEADGGTRYIQLANEMWKSNQGN